MLCLTISKNAFVLRCIYILNNCKSGVNRHLRFFSFSKNSRNVPCVGAYYSLNHGTHKAHFRVKMKDHQYLAGSGVTQAFFLRRIAESSQRSIIL